MTTAVLTTNRNPNYTAAPHGATFDAVSSDLSGQGSILTARYEWFLYDSANVLLETGLDGPVFHYTFEDPGTYRVYLRVFNESDTSETASLVSSEITVDAPAPGITRYVDPVGGSDAADGLTLGTAWKTQTKAQSGVAQDWVVGGLNRLYIVGGGTTTYLDAAGTAFDYNSGTLGRGVLELYGIDGGGGRPVIRSAASSGSAIVNLWNDIGLRVVGVNIEGPYDYDSGTGNLIHGISRTVGGATTVDEAWNVVLVDCAVTGCNQGVTLVDAGAGSTAQGALRHFYATRLNSYRNANFCFFSAGCEYWGMRDCEMSFQKAESLWRTIWSSYGHDHRLYLHDQGAENGAHRIQSRMGDAWGISRYHFCEDLRGVGITQLAHGSSGSNEWCEYIYYARARLTCTHPSAGTAFFWDGSRNCIARACWAYSPSQFMQLNSNVNTLPVNNENLFYGCSGVQAGGSACYQSNLQSTSTECSYKVFACVHTNLKGEGQGSTWFHLDNALGRNVADVVKGSDYNFLFSPNNPDVRWGVNFASGSQDLPTWQTAHSLDQNSQASQTTTDPDFVNPTPNPEVDLHMGPNSKILGLSTAFPEMRYDVDGRIRTAPHDPGCHDTTSSQTPELPIAAVATLNAEPRQFRPATDGSMRRAKLAPAEKVFFRAGGAVQWVTSGIGVMTGSGLFAGFLEEDMDNTAGIGRPVRVVTKAQALLRITKGGGPLSQADVGRTVYANGWSDFNVDGEGVAIGRVAEIPSGLLATPNEVWVSFEGRGRRSPT